MNMAAPMLYDTARQRQRAMLDLLGDFQPHRLDELCRRGQYPHNEAAGTALRHMRHNLKAPIDVIYLEAGKHGGRRVAYQLTAAWDFPPPQPRPPKLPGHVRKRPPPRGSAGVYLNKIDGYSPPPPTSPRPCLCCRGIFESEGKHHRLCPSCTSIDPGPASFALAGISVR